MESIACHRLIEVTQNEFMKIRKQFDLDSKKIKENLNSIEEWLKKQDHLSQALPHLDRNILERFHILGRGSVEQTKSIIDKVLTIKAIMSEMLPNEPKLLLNNFDNILDNVLITTLPKVNPYDNSRVCLFRILKESYENMDILNYAQVSCFILEMRMRYDYIFTDRLILDLKHVKTSIITQINPVVLKKLEFIFTDSYKVKIKSFHVINAPPFINKLLSIAKQVFKEKLAKRFHIHNNYKELHEEISKEVLPSDYDGEQMSCQKMAEEWKSYFKTEEAKRILENSNEIVSDETKRNDFMFNEYLGMPGSFKQLHFD